MSTNPYSGSSGMEGILWTSPCSVATEPANPSHPVDCTQSQNYSNPNLCLDYTVSVTMELTNTGTANQGVVLPTGVPGMRVLVWNSTGNTIKIYPAGTGTIDGGSASAAQTLTSAHRAAEFFCQSANTWVSALVGAATS